MSHCTACGEELSEYSACACAFTPRYPRASTSSATSAPMSMRGLLAQKRAEPRPWETLTPAQRGTLARLAQGPTYVHCATASRLLLFGYVRLHSPATSTSYRSMYELTPEGLEAHRAIARALEADRSAP